MGFSTEEVRALKAQIDVVLASGRVNAWQRRFLTDIGDRIGKSGVNTRLSERQASKLWEIIGGGTSERLPSKPQTYFRIPAKRWRRQSRNALAREARWWGRRLSRDFAFAAALVMGFIVYSFIQQNPLTALSLSRFSADPVLRDRFTVTDGDTIRFKGEAKGTRLVGFNTPETFEAECSSERALGNRATARLREIIATSDLLFENVRCSCPPGTEGTEACNYGRSCGTLSAGGHDVGQILISEGLAVPFICGATSCPPTPRPWCG